MKLRGAILACLFLLCAVAAFGPPAFSQGCAMCYSSAKGASDGGQRAIRQGVLVLLIPSLGFMSLGVWMAYRYAKKRDLEQEPSPNVVVCNASENPAPSVRRLTLIEQRRRLLS